MERLNADRDLVGGLSERIGLLPDMAAFLLQHFERLESCGDDVPDWVKRHLGLGDGPTDIALLTALGGWSRSHPKVQPAVQRLLLQTLRTSDSESQRMGAIAGMDAGLMRSAAAEIDEIARQETVPYLASAARRSAAALRADSGRRPAKTA